MLPKTRNDWKEVFDLSLLIIMGTLALISAATVAAAALLLLIMAVVASPLVLTIPLAFVAIGVAGFAWEHRHD